jgi:hypothetical protein
LFWAFDLFDFYFSGGAGPRFAGHTDNHLFVI